MSFLDRFKCWLWARGTPAFLLMRDGLLRLGILRHDFRQEFPLGRLADGCTADGLCAHLAAHGFEAHAVAWIDKDEVLGMRKRVGIHWQYHLRVFADGEVRGHFEWTPESRPLRHILEIGMEPRREDFLAFLGDWVAFEKPRASLPY